MIKLDNGMRRTEMAHLAFKKFEMTGKPCKAPYYEPNELR